jgi:hypothetical protein
VFLEADSKSDFRFEIYDPKLPIKSLYKFEVRFDFEADLEKTKFFLGSWF